MMKSTQRTGTCGTPLLLTLALIVASATFVSSFSSQAATSVAVPTTSPVVPTIRASPFAASSPPSTSSLGRRHRRPDSISLQALLDPYIIDSATLSTTSSILSDGIAATSTATIAAGSSVDSIKTAFSVATFLPQPFWLFLIFLPNTGVTKKLFGGMELITVFCLVHLFIVYASILEPGGTAPMAEFNDVFDPR